MYKKTVSPSYDKLKFILPDYLQGRPREVQLIGTLTEGIVKNLLTSAPKHHRGIKVRLEDGQIGRVQQILN